MIKAIIFDNGGVITPGGNGTELTDRLGANLGISGNAAYALLSPLWDKYFRGAITEDELWQDIESRYGAAISTEKRAIWNTWGHMQPYSEMLQFVEELKRRGYVVGMLSNVIPNTEKEVRTNGGYDPFDFVVLSCEVGFAKPDPEIYQLAAEKAGSIAPSEIIFLDDAERFLEPAHKVGWHTVKVTSPSQAIADVRAIIGA
jgi:putative hydrolase of the HAD superfamily